MMAVSGTWTGAIFDSNAAFDSIFVAAAASSMTLTVAKTPDANVTGNSALNNPGEKLTLDLKLSSIGVADKTNITVPYNIYFVFAKIADITINSVAYVYDPWEWVAVCKNTKMGEDVTSASAGTTTTPTMSTTTPTCTKVTLSTSTGTASGYALKIPVTAAADALVPLDGTWAGYEVKF